MTTRFGLLVGGLSAIGLTACGQVDSMVGAMDASGGLSGAGAGGGTSAGTGAGTGRGSGGTEPSGAGADAGGRTTSSGGSSSAGMGAVGGETTTCTEVTPLGPRLVRLTFQQLLTSIGALLGEEAERVIAQTSKLEPAAFPPLASPSEGSAITDSVFARSDALAQAAGKYVLDHFDAVTGCGATPSDACAQEFVSDFVERAFRRPPSDEETANILQVYAEAKGFGSTVAQAVEAAVTATLDSPLFVYRPEFDSTNPAAGAELALAPYQLASELSYFLSNRPPDPALLEAASAGALETAEQLVAHVDRLLESDVPRVHLETAFAAYLGLPNLERVVIDDPALTSALRASMGIEARAFLERQLWTAPLAELTTSRQSRVDASLAELYGIAFPPAGASLDASGFADVVLPAERAGFLTLAALLTASSRVDGPSVVTRGLRLNATLLCATNPPFPEDAQLVGRLEAADRLTGATEREKAEYRMSIAPCAGCHSLSDPLGLALDGFDAIGRYRTTDPEGRAIDTAVTLPPALEGAPVSGAAELGAVIGESERFVSCMARAFLGYALAEGPALAPESCAVQDIVREYVAEGDPTFSGLVRRIALSKRLTHRTP